MVQDALTAGTWLVFAPPVGVSLFSPFPFLSFLFLLAFSFLSFLFLLAFSFSFSFCLFMTSKEFIPLNRPTPTSFPIHLSWSPRMWFLPCTFEVETRY